MGKIIVVKEFKSRQFKSFNELVKYLCSLNEQSRRGNDNFHRDLFENQLINELLLEYKNEVKKRAKIVYGKNTKVRIKNDAKFIEDLVKLGELKIEINTEEAK